MLFWGGFNTAMEFTNTEQFCVACHEMRDNVYQEIPADHPFHQPLRRARHLLHCHVPHNWTFKMARKMQASKEVWGRLFGTIDTREEFLAKGKSLRARVGAAESERLARMSQLPRLPVDGFHRQSKRGAGRIPSSCRAATRPASTATRASRIASPKWPASNEPRRPAAKTEEWRTWVFFTLIMAPLAAVLIVSGFGFVVWMWQTFIAGPSY